MDLGATLEIGGPFASIGAVGRAARTRCVRVAPRTAARPLRLALGAVGCDVLDVAGAGCV